MIILTRDQIIAKIKNPQAAESLTRARIKQDEFKQFYANEFPELVSGKVSSWLTPQKFEAFKMKGANHSQDLVDSIITHYRKIYNASGKNLDLVFEGDGKAEVSFHELREKVSEGISDIDYIKTEGHEVAFIEPNSVYITGRNEENEIRIRRYPLSKIVDVGASVSGIEYIIIGLLLPNPEKPTEEEKNYFIWDGENFSHYKEVKREFVELKTEPHGNTVCPAIFAYPENANIGNHVLKKSRLTDSIKDFYTYNILKTFYFVYKGNSAYTREIRAKTRCDYKTEEAYCQDGNLTSNTDGVTLGTCPSCSKNPAIMGEIIEIPLAQQANPDFVSNIPNLFLRQEADATILTFHSEDLVNLKNEILDATIGKGFGQATRNQALNTDQVAINFDSMEANLDEFRDNVQKVINFSMNRVGELYSNGFKKFAIFFGNKYFLKSTELLYQELELIIKATSNTADIQQKQSEIILTENRHDESFLLRHFIVQALQPFALLGNTWVNENRGFLEKAQRNALIYFDNFNQALQLFEMFNETKIENFGKELNPEARIKKINEELLRILTKNILSLEDNEALNKATGRTGITQETNGAPGEQVVPAEGNGDDMAGNAQNNIVNDQPNANGSNEGSNSNEGTDE